MNKLSTEEIRNIINKPSADNIRNMSFYSDSYGNSYGNIHHKEDLVEILSLRETVEKLERTNKEQAILYNKLADYVCHLEHNQTQAKADAIEKAVKLYTHEWKEEFAEVAINIMRNGSGYIYPEGLMEYARQIREGEDD